MNETDKKRKEKINYGCLGCIGVLLLLPVGLFASVLILFPNRYNELMGKFEVKEWLEKDANGACEGQLKEGLKDPWSYRRNGDIYISNDSDSERVLSWEFRAKNGYGGYTISTAKCRINKEDIRIGSRRVFVSIDE